MAKLTGKIAVVTGGSRGIGAAIAKGLGKEGATVIINYNHSHEEAETVVNEIMRSKPWEVWPLPCRLTSLTPKRPRSSTRRP